MTQFYSSLLIENTIPNHPPARNQSRRLIALIAVGILLIGGLFAYFHFNYRRPIGNGPAGPKVSHALFSTPWSDRPVLLVGLGDSVTAGFGARKGYSYFDRLVANSADEFEDMRGICLKTVLPRLQFTNMSVSGSTSRDHVQRQLPRLPMAESDVIGIVVLTTGGNDIIHNYGRTPPRDQAMYGATWEQAQPWIAAFEQRLNSMLESIQAHFPGGCHIFLANIYDPTDGRGDIERAGLPAWKDGMKIHEAYNAILRRSSEKHRGVHLVDLHSPFLGHGIHCTQFWSKHYDSEDPHYWYHVNLEDPNERGYDAIRRLFLTEIAKVAGQLK